MAFNTALIKFAVNRGFRNLGNLDDLRDWLAPSIEGYGAVHLFWVNLPHAQHYTQPAIGKVNFSRMEERGCLGATLVLVRMKTHKSS